MTRHKAAASRAPGAAVAELDRAIGEARDAGVPAPHCPAAPPEARDAPVQVSIVSFSGFNSWRQGRAEQAAQLLERVLDSEEFHTRMLAGNMHGCNGYTSVTGMTPEQIYRKIVGQPVRLHLKLYWNPFTSGIGEATVGDLEGPIKMNRKFFDRFTPAEIADNMAHEWSHQLGFEHASESDLCSVPYQVGDLVEELAQREAF